MIKFITILIGCSITLAAGVRAEQAEQEDPKKKPVQKPKAVQKQQFTPKQHTVPNAHVKGVHTQQNPNINNAKIHDSNVSKQQLHTSPAVQSHYVPPVQSNKLPAVQTDKLPAVQTNKLPPAQTNKLPPVQTNKQTVQSIHSAHLNFHARPSTTVTSVQFNQHYRVQGSQNWQGHHYEVFRTYRPQWHDRGWWHSHHNHLILIGGGWYFWNAGYWFPAWGYDSAAAYYPYDGPIYVGNNPRPFDQVVADAQSVLQEQGYYHGEVDGLVGPLTQEALADYQRAQGLEPTAAIDEPTLESLGLG